MAYASVVSVMYKIDRLLHPSSHSHTYSKTKILLPHPQLFQPIYGELFSLERILEEYICEMKGSKMRFDTLELQIQDAADEIDDLLEAWLASSEESLSHLTCSNSNNKLLPSPTDTLREKRDEEEADQQERVMEEAASLRRIYDFGGQTVFVGLDAEVKQLQSSVMGGPSDLKIISVWGMAGIAKTALVRKIYDHFDLCIWVTIGPNYKQLEEFIRQFIDSSIISTDVSYKKVGNGPDLDLELGHRILWRRRYLVVLDDVWSINIWDHLRRFFPENRNRSRVILTSRLFDVADHARHGIEVYKKQFLDDEESWSLLRQMVFTSPEEHCKFELEKFGRKIAQNCEGLPLAILAVAKQLRTAEKTVEYWEEVSEQENLRDIIKDDYANIVESLALSYNMMPRRLKECFLYIGIVPKYKISVAELIKLWDVERFLPSRKYQSIEYEVEQSSKEAVKHSVVLVHEKRSQGGMKICRIHFVFRSLCVSEAQNEKFCYVMRKYK